jgi:hypothetical protein
MYEGLAILFIQRNTTKSTKQLVHLKMLCLPLINHCLIVLMHSRAQEKMSLDQKDWLVCRLLYDRRNEIVLSLLGEEDGTEGALLLCWLPGMLSSSGHSEVLLGWTPSEHRGPNVPAGEKTWIAGSERVQSHCIAGKSEPTRK